MQLDEAAFEIVDDGTWVSMDLVCGYEDGWNFGAPGTLPETLEPVEAVRRFVPGVLPQDRVELAGYPEYLARSFVRIVRDGDVIALARPLDRGQGLWQIEGYACPAAALDDREPEWISDALCG